ncbi:unnamed protein product, partial [Scytosiphon promiscuus]
SSVQLEDNVGGRPSTSPLGAHPHCLLAVPPPHAQDWQVFLHKMEKATTAEGATPAPTSAAVRSRFVPELHRPKTSTQRSRSPLEQERPGSGEPARDLLGGESGSAWDMLSWANGVLGRGAPAAAAAAPSRHGDNPGNDGGRDGGGDGGGGSRIAFPVGSNPSPREFTKLDSLDAGHLGRLAGHVLQRLRSCESWTCRCEQSNPPEAQQCERCFLARAKGDLSRRCSGGRTSSWQSLSERGVASWQSKKGS